MSPPQRGPPDPLERSLPLLPYIPPSILLLCFFVKQWHLPLEVIVRIQMS